MSSSSDMTVLHGPQSQRHPFKDITYGSIAGMGSKLFEHPFDLVKVRLQTQPANAPKRFLGPWDCFRQTLSHERFRGLYRGVSMPVIGAMAENATLFGVYGQVQRLIRYIKFPTHSSNRHPSPPQPLPLSCVALAAACSGAAASFVLTPIELVKCKMQVQKLASQIPSKPLAGPLTIARNVIKDLGFKGLWLGQTGTLLRETGGSVIWFCTFETIVGLLISHHQATIPNQSFSKAHLSSLELMSSGAIAGILYNFTFFPADSIKSTIQTASELDPNRSSTNQSFLQVGRHIVNSRGWKGLYAGCGITCLRSAPSSALIFWIVSRLESKFG
ncbi:hypothetical protein O181_096610 [Austropuccinia psidii MF-1]|uniref:Mitochondrial carrier n=1 Tax=Austropuccinia psidii MF-1 TaxID=1389203 RepID=A0A9Q3PD58_9BASI|nr:hypothetical protein [Austropuccinia psidii MF-1]